MASTSTSVTSASPRELVADNNTLIRLEYPLAASADATCNLRGRSRSLAAARLRLLFAAEDSTGASDGLETFDEVIKFICSCWSFLSGNVYLTRWMLDRTIYHMQRRSGAQVLFAH